MDLEVLRRTAVATLKAQGLEEWKFSFDRGLNRFGRCSYSTKTISMSKALSKANSVEQCMDTLFHEVAHALVGHRAAHGPLWQAKARELGASGKARYSSQEVVTVYKYLGTCPSCQSTVRRHRRNLKNGCGLCYHSGKGFHRLLWTEVAPRVTSA